MSDAATQEATPQAPASLWEDFIDIFYAPREVFARRQNGKFGLVLLIVTLLTTLLFFAMQGPLGDAFAAEMQRAMQRSGGAAPQMTPEQAAGARRMGAIFGTLAVAVGYPIGICLIGLVLWGLGKMFDFASTAALAILIVTYAQFPRVAGSVVTLLEGILLNPATLAETSVGPARFLDPRTTQPFLMAMLMRMDVFYIWSTILIAIGAHVIGRVPKTQAYVLAAIIWIVGAIPTVLPALLQG